MDPTESGLDQLVINDEMDDFTWDVVAGYGLSLPSVIAFYGEPPEKWKRIIEKNQRAS